MIRFCWGKKTNYKGQGKKKPSIVTKAAKANTAMPCLENSKSNLGICSNNKQTNQHRHIPNNSHAASGKKKE